MNELNLYNTKNNSINKQKILFQETNLHTNHPIQSGGKINKNDTSKIEHDHDHNLSENNLSAERLYRKRMLEQQKYIHQLEEHIKQLESRIHI